MQHSMQYTQHNQSFVILFSTGTAIGAITVNDALVAQRGACDKNNTRGQSCTGSSINFLWCTLLVNVRDIVYENKV